MSETLYCPICEPKYFGKNMRRGNSLLHIIEFNYSGCGVNIANCPDCTRCFEISYKVDKIKQIKGR